MKIKYITMSKSKFLALLKQYNLLVKSLCPYNIVLRQFNLLNPQMRQEIKTRLELCDKIRKTKIPSNEGDAILTCIMVDAHIIACEYDVDPLTVIMCINLPCKINERILLK